MDNTNNPTPEPAQPTWAPAGSPPQATTPPSPGSPFTLNPPEPAIPANPIQSLDPIAPTNGTPPQVAPDLNTNPFLNTPNLAPAPPQTPLNTFAPQPPAQTPPDLSAFGTQQQPQIQDQIVPSEPPAPVSTFPSSAIQDLSQLTSTTPPQPQETAAPAPPPQPVDTAPTDLSHLIGNQEDQTAAPNMYAPPATQTGAGSGGAAVVPPTPVPQAATQPAEAAAMGSHFNPTKILIIVGVVVLLLVSGLSAYFFFGPGRQAPTPTSLPAQAEQAPLTNPPKATVESTPEPTFTAQPTASASASTSFGTIGNESSGSAETNGNSAVDLLRSRRASGN